MTDPVQNLQLRNEGLDLAHVVGVLLPRGTERVLVQEQLRDVLTPLQDTLQQQQYITMFSNCTHTGTQYSVQPQAAFTVTP